MPSERVPRCKSRQHLRRDCKDARLLVASATALLNAAINRENMTCSLALECSAARNRDLQESGNRSTGGSPAPVRACLLTCVDTQVLNACVRGLALVCDACAGPVWWTCKAASQCSRAAAANRGRRRVPVAVIFAAISSRSSGSKAPVSDHGCRNR